MSLVSSLSSRITSFLYASLLRLQCTKSRRRIVVSKVHPQKQRQYTLLCFGKFLCMNFSIFSARCVSYHFPHYICIILIICIACFISCEIRNNWKRICPVLRFQQPVPHYFKLHVRLSGCALVHCVFPSRTVLPHFLRSFYSKSFPNISFNPSFHFLVPE